VVEAQVLKVFIASPADTMEERNAARTTIWRWNSDHAEHEHVVLLSVGWETDAVPEYGEAPQAILNRQLVDECDVLIGIFWTRLGTPTADGASGTVEEIERFAAAGKPVLLYFSSKPTDPTRIESSQLDRVNEFRASCSKIALYDTFSDLLDFARKLDRHLTHSARKHAASAPVGGAVGRRLGAAPVRKAEPRLSGHLESYGRNSSKFILANTGTVDLHMVDLVVPEAAGAGFSIMRDELPIDILRPGERVGLMTFASMGGGRSIFDITLLGTTAEGTPHEFPCKIST
jgi:hypothetical protein